MFGCCFQELFFVLENKKTRKTCLRERMIFARSHNIRLSGSHNFIKLLHCIITQPWENIEIVSKLAVALTYGGDPIMIIYSIKIESLLMEASSNKYS